MSIRIKSSEFFEGAGAGSQDFVSQLADKIPRFACQLWQQYPSFLTGFRNPATSYVRGYMNNMCASIQPPVPAPEIPFTGGQCEVRYNVNILVDVYPSTVSCGRDPSAQSTFSITVWGPLGGARLENPTGVCGGFAKLIVDCHGNGAQGRLPTQEAFTISDFSYGRFSEVVSFTFSRVDGLPDDCGSPPVGYPPESPPTQDDLSTTIIINNEDGLDLTVPLIWNQIDPEFNFPMSFDVGGINATLDIGGLTLDADVTLNFEGDAITRRIINVDGDTVEVPGDNGRTVAPEPVQQELESVVAEYVECIGGETTDETTEVGVAKGSSEAYALIIKLLTDLLREACGARVDLGLPEIYPVLPGADRPVIMYYFKEDLGGKRGRSTYVSTLPNPSLSAIAEIEDVNVPARQLGKFVLSLKLLDGSRIVARGKTEGEASLYFGFLLARVEPTLIPDDVDSKKILTENQRLQEVNVKCSQIEYYPDGKSFARTASVRRVINFD